MDCCRCDLDRRRIERTYETVHFLPLSAAKTAALNPGAMWCRVELGPGVEGVHPKRRVSKLSLLPEAAEATFSRHSAWVPDLRAEEQEGQKKSRSGQPNELKPKAQRGHPEASVVALRICPISIGQMTIPPSGISSDATDPHPLHSKSSHDSRSCTFAVGPAMFMCKLT